MRNSRLHKDESGIAMIAVVMGSFLIAMLAFLVISNSERQIEGAYRIYRDDRILAATEAQLERYAALLTEDGLYYAKKVDEAERARKCIASPIPASIGVVREPGENWADLDCTTFDYQDPTTGWYESPVIVTANNAERVEIQMELTPPADGDPLTVAIVGRNLSKTQIRSISAGMRAEALSEYVRSSNGNLSYGAGADITGKVFANGDLSFTTGNTVHADVFARGQITNPPIYLDGALAYVGSYRSGQSPPQYNDFANTSLATFDFNSIWQQTQAVKTAACLGNGLCLDQPGARAYLVEPIGSNLKVWYSTSNFSSSCSNVIMASTGHSDSTWTTLGTFPIPENGAVWVNGDAVIGDRHTSGSIAYIEDSFTIYAGDNGDTIPGLPTSGQQQIIVNKSIMVAARDGSIPGGSEVAALIASGEAYLKKAAGQASGNHLTLEASLLTQGGIFRGTSCGASSATTEFTFRGSLTSQGTGSMSSIFTPRNYGFDPRLASIRPPFFPLVNDQWWWQNWRETAIPDWAK